MKFIGFYDYTVWLTYISLASALVGMLQASKGNLGAAVFCIMFSGFCDMFDGIVARTKKDRTQDQKNFGIQIDSLTDVIAFGVTPAVVFYFHGVKSTLGVVILIAYVLCGLARLAFFNVLETKRQMSEDGCAKFYRGLPVTSAAIIFPFFYLLGYYWLPCNVTDVINHVLPWLVGLLFILDFRLPKLDVGKLFKGKKH